MILMTMGSREIVSSGQRRERIKFPRPHPGLARGTETEKMMVGVWRLGLKPGFE